MLWLMVFTLNDLKDVCEKQCMEIKFSLSEINTKIQLASLGIVLLHNNPPPPPPPSLLKKIYWKCQLRNGIKFVSASVCSVSLVQYPPRVWRGAPSLPIWMCTLSCRGAPSPLHTLKQRQNVHHIVESIFSNAFLWMKSFVFWFKFHWSFFIRVQLMIRQHWFR